MDTPVQGSSIPRKISGPTYVPLGSIRRGMRMPTVSQSPECLLTGRVLSERGIPLPEADITIYASEPDNSTITPIWPNPIVAGICDSQGRYIIHLAQSLDNAVIRVRKQGYATIQDRRHLYVPGNSRKDYTLHEGCACIDGTVINDGRLVPRARVDVTFPFHAVLGDRERPIRTSVLTDSTGSFRLEGLVEGYATVIVLAPGFQQRESTFSTVCGPCERLDLKIQTGHTISFVVKNVYGHPIPGASARVQLANSSMPMGKDEYGVGMWGARPRAQADDRGIIELVVPPDTGTFDCQISSPQYQTAHATIDPMSPPEAVTLQAAPKFNGVVLTDSGDPVPGVEVTVYEDRYLERSSPPGPQQLFSAPPREMVQTGTDLRGGFQVILPFSKVGRVVAKKEGFQETSVEFGGMEPVWPVEIFLKSQETGVFGRLMDSEGRPVTHYILMISSSAPNRNIYSREVENSEGRFLITDIPPGIYVIRILMPSSSPQSVYTGSEEIILKSGFVYGEVAFQSTNKEPAKK